MTCCASADELPELEQRPARCWSVTGGRSDNDAKKERRKLEKLPAVDLLLHVLSCAYGGLIYRPVPRPQFIEPCAPILSSQPPSGLEWLHEVKWDGWRCQIIKDGEKVSILSRHRTGWTSRLPKIVDAVQALPAKSLILDGELLSDRLNFYTLAHAIRRQEVFVYVFDILHLDGESTRHLPLIERKKLLAKTVKAEPMLLVSEYFDDGQALFEACGRQNMEGVVSKRKDLPYKSGKCIYWRKSKCEAWREENKERYKQFERR